jgi:hypothetical protein
MLMHRVKIHLLEPALRFLKRFSCFIVTLTLVYLKYLGNFPACSGTPMMFSENTTDFKIIFLIIVI